jgi:3-oxoacyl-[acyl-carrier-protein] synthase-3
MGFSFLQQQSFKKVLVLDGETRSRVYHPKDRQVAFLFGDGGVAALLEKDEKYGDSYFSLNSDGSRKDLIKIDAGGYRLPSSAETVKEKVIDHNGNIRTAEHGYMNGPDVFNFVLREIPRDIKLLMAHAGKDLQDLDHYVFHQANQYMNSYLAKKLKIDASKAPTCLESFGNTSSVSIPLTIVSRLQKELVNRKDILLCGFGVGMSWASANLIIDNCHIPDLLEI